MREGMREQTSRLLGEEPTSVRPVGGGNIGESFRVSLRGGAECFVKTYPGAPPEMVTCEARGLAWLAEAGAGFTE